MLLRTVNGQAIDLAEGPAWVRCGEITDARGVTYSFDREGNLEGGKNDSPRADDRGGIRPEKAAARAATADEPPAPEHAKTRRRVYL